MTWPAPLAGLQRCEGASQQAIDAIEQYFEIRLPDDYRVFLAASNGIEGFLGEGGYLSLYSAEDVVELSGIGCIKEFAPGFLMVGSDGGGELFGLLKDETGSLRYVRTPAIGLLETAIDEVGSTFLEMLEWIEADESDEVD